jgi:hypothetical protein
LRPVLRSFAMTRLITTVFALGIALGTSAMMFAATIA